MAYQRFSDQSDLYIFQNIHGDLEVVIKGVPTTATVSRDASRLTFSRENIHEAKMLFGALYDLLLSNDVTVKIKKDGHMKIKDPLSA